MPKNIPIRILGDRKAERRLADGSKIIGLELDIFGRRLDFRIAAVGNARLANIIPAARVICDKITEITIEQIRIQGGNVPCHKECPACCSYLVSLSVPEVLCFRQDIFRKHTYQLNHTLRTYLYAAKRLMKNRPPNHIFESFSNSSNNISEIQTLANWYAGLNLTCPFLRNNQCAIYKQRPFVCREYFVAGSAQGCSRGSGEAQVIEMPVQMGNVLCRLSKELCDVSDAVMMPLALSWCDVNKQLQLCERTWPAEVMTKLFVEIIKETVSVPVYS
jgi:Fe-S-cluster containining protein